MQYVLEDSDEVVAIHIHSWKLDVINMIAGNSVTASNNHFTATAGLLSTIAQCEKEYNSNGDQRRYYFDCNFKVEK